MSADLIAFFNLIFAPIRAPKPPRTPDTFRRYDGSF